ncbi:MAG: methyltransferase regulatory domain-containing protein [Acidobacteriaceae bacterium]
MSSSYDAVPYFGKPFARTHPSRLATSASLFGMKPQPVERCRVLELGCTDGGNLIPMAFGLPESTFVGVDLSAVEVATGQDVIQQLGLGNIELHAMDLTRISGAWGKFDYILAHGIYSWVADPVRDAILRIAQENLAPQGVAFVSYNAQPGGYIRQMFREMMLHHISGVEEPGERIAKARELLRFLQTSTDGRDEEYRTFAVGEVSAMLERPDDSLFHDDLEEEWKSFFFHEFIAHARQHGLQFLAEGEYWEMADNGLHSSALANLDEMSGGGRLAREQYRDFLKCRRFRRTLLCHENVALDGKVKPNAMRRLYATSHSHQGAVTTDEESSGVRAFYSESGAEMKTAHPLVIALVSRLRESCPWPLHFDELLAEFGAENAEAISDILLSMHAAGLVELAAWRPAFASAAGERPEASALARLQIRRGSDMTTLMHTVVEAKDDHVKRLVSLLDGTRDRAALTRELMGTTPAGGNAEMFALELEENLKTVARLPLLVR